MSAILFYHSVFKIFTRLSPGYRINVHIGMGNKFPLWWICLRKIPKIDQFAWDYLGRGTDQASSVLREKAIFIHFIVDFGFLRNIFLGIQHVEREKTMFISGKAGLNKLQGIVFRKVGGKLLIFCNFDINNGNDMAWIPNLNENIACQVVLKYMRDLKFLFEDEQQENRKGMSL